MKELLRENELTKIQKIALELLKGKTDILFTNADKKTEIIYDACDFAEMFIAISEDPMMTWNGGEGVE